MDRMYKFVLFAFILMEAGACFAQQSQMVSSSTNFSVKFILGTCKGSFEGPTGKILFNEKNPESSSFDLSIDVNSFNTNNNTRDKDMKSDKYFHVSKYPKIRFKSSKVEKKGDKYQTTGTLTMKDISKTVTLPFEANTNADGTISLSSTFEVNRLDYNIGAKDWKLKDIVTVTLKAIIK